MTNHSLRSVAVLALLIMAPFARAITVTQTFAQDNHFDVLGTSVGGASLILNITPAAPGLLAVIFSASIDVDASSFDQNVFSFPISYTPRITVTTTAGLGPGLALNPEVSTFVTGPTEILAPRGASGISAIVHQDIFREFTLPAQLAAFVGTNTIQAPLRVTVIGNNSNGFLEGDTSVRATITYVYATPDSGVTATLLGGAFLGMVLLRSRHRK